MTESSFLNLIQQSYDNMREGIPYHNRYALTDTEKLMEYMWIKPYDSALDYDIFVDDGGSYLRENHPLLLFVRNGFGRNCNEFIPISVSSDPKILDVNIDVNIPLNELYKIKQFVITNKNLLAKFANGKLLPDDFIENLVIP